MAKKIDAVALRRLGLQVINIEAAAIQELVKRIDEKFVTACRCMLECQGRIVVTGMGKSGHVAKKIAATLASTGTPAFFVHPGEASHGDLGMITPNDVVLALSNSGETEEILTILPIIKRLGVPMIAMTGNTQSTLARLSSINIDVSVEKEACPLGLAPTSSTTATLVMGDALAVSLLDARGFSEDDFAFSHPAGSLGKRLFLKVSDLMRTGGEIPFVHESAVIKEVLIEVTEKKLGMTAIVDHQKRVRGIFTDGDLRRMFEQEYDVHSTSVTEVMTRNCTTIDQDILAAEAVKIMETNKINALLVVSDDNRLIGALNMHDLLRAGII